MKNILIAVCLIFVTALCLADSLESIRQAAEQGQDSAQTCLGKNYMLGDEIPRDFSLAYKWLSLAATQGNKDARKFLNDLEVIITPGQREEGQRMISEWKPKLVSSFNNYNASSNQTGYPTTPSDSSCFNSYNASSNWMGYQTMPSDSRCSASSLEFHLERHGGGYELPVRINNAITLNFMVDSGASEVTIPADVALTLLRTGTIQQNDFLSDKTVALADGFQLQSMRVVIHELSINGCRVSNVSAMITPMTGSLLLGQSFLKRFKRWTLDNERHLLIIETADRSRRGR